MSLAEATVAGMDDVFTSIPLIDLSKCDTPDGRLTTAREIRNACMRVGFFYVRNHGIPQSRLDSVLDAAKTYFSLPMATKMKRHYKTLPNSNGYSSPFDSNMDSANNDKGDFHEAFDFGREEIEWKARDEKGADDGALVAASVWPSDDCPEFRAACLEYYHAAMNVGKTLFPLFALALGLPETYFDDKTQNSVVHMTLLHYPPRNGYLNIDDDTLGIGAHTDFQVRVEHRRSCFTILWQQPEIQALQVMNSEKRWIDVPAIEDTLVVNIGDQLAMWTNDVFKSTIHRVVNKSGKERYSIPLFFGTDYCMNIEPIPSCVSADRPAKYSPITAGEYVNMRLKNMYNIA